MGKISSKSQEIAIEDWFNPYDKTHVAAYLHLEDTGDWPNGFLPGGVQFRDNWQCFVLGKLGQAWLDAVNQELVQLK